MALFGAIDKFNRLDRQLSERYTKGTKHKAKNSVFTFFFCYPKPPLTFSTGAADNEG